jgi:hypothetical protein
MASMLQLDRHRLTVFSVYTGIVFSLFRVIRTKYRIGENVGVQAPSDQGRLVGERVRGLTISR